MSFAGERVPLLDSVLALPAEVFELEIKTWGRAVLDVVVDAVDRAGVFDRVKFTGWNHPMLCRLKAERPDATIGLFAQQPQPWKRWSILADNLIDFERRARRSGTCRCGRLL